MPVASLARERQVGFAFPPTKPLHLSLSGGSYVGKTTDPSRDYDYNSSRIGGRVPGGQHVTDQNQAQRSSRRRKVAQPFDVVCVKCESKMALTRSEPRSTYGHQFERKTYQCRSCANIQTYTMGAAGVPRA